MRSFLVIVMMLLLPAQWTWAAAASVCAHEKTTQSAHFGHHEHAHQGAASLDGANDDGQGGSLAEHPDCGACHGMNSAFVPAFGSVPELWLNRSHYEPYASAVPDRIVDTLLRPPLSIAS